MWEYYTIMRISKDKQCLRWQIVQYALENGVKPAARAFHTTPKTVRKWLNRWKESGRSGLVDQSKAPRNPKRYITEEQKNLVINLKKEFPSFGAARLKRDFELPISEKAIRKIWKENGLLKRRRKKHKTKRCLREIKKNWPLFSQVDMDTKYLDDIPEYLLQMVRNNLPKYQYTARDVVTGLQFISYSYERSLAYSALFAQLVIQHLQDNNVKVENNTMQTDNGSEFIGNWNAKRDSRFTKVIESYGMVHKTIPPAAYTYQSDVETVHNLIEAEFYELEKFNSPSDLLSKAHLYTLWFNSVRKNSGKENKSPWEIIRERDPSISPSIVNFPPVILDKLFSEILNYYSGGYHVIPHPWDQNPGKILSKKSD